MGPVLVGYASAYGSTRGIAERIADRLAARGVRAEVRPLAPGLDVSAYDACVLGSAIHNQAWLPEAKAFLDAHLPDLSARPVWLFSVGMPGALPRPLRRWSRQEGPKVVADLPPVQARGDRLFSGALRPEHLPGLSRVLVRLMGVRYGDYQEWPEIEAWADEIAAALAGP